MGAFLHFNIMRVKVLKSDSMKSSHINNGERMRYRNLLFIHLIFLILLLNTSCLNKTTAPSQARWVPTLFSTEQRGVVYRKTGSDFDGVIRVDCSFYDKAGKVLLKFDTSHCSLLSEQGLIVSRGKEAISVQKLNKTVVWEKPQFGHHDLYVSPKNKRIVSVVRNKNLSGRDEIWHDGVRVYSPEGQLLFSWDTADHIEEIQQLLSSSKESIAKRYYIDDDARKIGIKINSASLLEDHPQQQDFKEFSDDNVILSLNQLSLILIVDFKTQKIVWSYKLNDDFGYGVHAVRPLKNGRFLFFDNRSIFNGLPIKAKALPQVVELDPITKKRIWVYPYEKERAILSENGCSAHEMPNGHILISYEENHSVVEVTRSGEIVWEWFPYLLEAEGARSPIVHAEAMTWDEFNQFLKTAK